MIPEPPLHPLGYQEPQSLPRRTSFILAWIPLLLLWSVPTAVFLVISNFAIPRFEAIFKDFKVTLPPATRAALMVSRWTHEGGGWLLIWIFPLCMATFFALIRPPVREKGLVTRMRLQRWLSFLVMLTLVIFMIFALFGPIMLLIDKLSSGKK